MLFVMADQPNEQPCGSRNPCQNGATCVILAGDGGDSNLFCQCTYGWTGPSCTICKTFIHSDLLIYSGFVFIVVVVWSSTRYMS